MQLMHIYDKNVLSKCRFICIHFQCLQQEGSQIKSPGDSSTPHNREDTITTLTTGEKVDASHRPLKNGHTIT